MNVTLRTAILFAAALLALQAGILRDARTATVVPTDVQQPGTQPGQTTLEAPNKCDNCHGGYASSVEPDFNWRGSMMANAARDPIFWATVAIAEQDFNGSGDICLRCHAPPGWLAGRSTPTDGSGLAAADGEGVTCDSCHKMTNPANSEHAGLMTPPFVANDGGNPATGYYGSGMVSISPDSPKLGPYADADPPHQFAQSRFHRDSRFCGSCHDVSNAVTGNLAHNNGRQPSAVGSVIANYQLGGAVDGKAAFNNFPYQYGVIERTSSEHHAGLLSQTLVLGYPNLPADLKAGAIRDAYEDAGGNYADGTPRYFTCQACHMRAVTGRGCNKNPPVRTDLPLHDLTGGNSWAADAILYQNSQGTLRLGGGMSPLQVDATTAGKARALENLAAAATLSVSGNSVKVVNLTGHKLITGYPEGRRMWLNIKWYDASNTLLREDGKYGDLAVSTPGAPSVVRTLLDLQGANTRIYEAHHAITQEWANQLLSLGYAASMPLAYDRVTGNVTLTLGQVGAQSPGTAAETFHFVLNNTVTKDTRIPTYGMSYDAALARNALPVPKSQYGNPGPGGMYQYYDLVTLNPPLAADHATISLLYQSTSWEYVQFLYLANNRTNAFLGNEGVNLLQAWANTSMADPVTMATATWTKPAVPTLLAVKSRKVHGAQGAFDLGIDTAQPVSGSVTVEPRSGTQKVVFQFDRALASAGTPACRDADGNPVGSAIAAAVGTEVEVTVSGLPPAQRATVSLSNVAGLGVNAAASIGFLAGDVNGTRAVTASDILRSKGRAGQGFSPDLFLFDVDLSGSFDAADVAADKAGSGLAL